MDAIPERPPKGADKKRAAQELEALGQEMFELQDLMWGARMNGRT